MVYKMKRSMLRRHKLMEEKAGRRLAKKMVTGLIGAQIFLSPLSGVAYASEITKADAANAGTVTAAGGVYTILADRMVGSDTALNHFSKFFLDRGNIANLYFGTSKSGSAANLINFVDSRINVNGVVNAIRNSKVGGNLYFLSVDGMTVGASGAVNAGSINIMTPTQSAFESLVKDAYTDASTDQTGNLAPNAVDDILNVQYAINPTGTISVAGKMNAPDGIIMKTANIDIQNGAVFNTAYNAAGGIDFSSLVNTKDANGNNVSAAINGGTLSATEGENGDIILAAVASSSASAPGESNWSDFLARTREAAITTAEESDITARGDATLSALATIKTEGWSSDNYHYDAGITNPLGEVSKASAKVEVNGDITAQTVNVAATATAKYNSSNDANTWQEISGDVDKMGRWTESYNWLKAIHDTLNVTPIYSYLESEAKVTVGKNAKLTSTTTELSKTVDDVTTPVTGVNIVASSTTDNTVAAASSSAEAPSISIGKSGDVERGSKEDEAKNGAGNNTAKTTHLLGAAVSYGGAYSTAEVKVEGEIDSQAAVNVEADANDYAWAKAVENGAKDTSHGTAPYFNAGIAVLTAGNTAKVEIADTAKITSEQAGVSIQSVMENEFDAEVSVQENANAIGSTGISVLQADTDAKVTVNGTVNAKNGDVTIDASNTFYRNNIYNDNGMQGKKTSANFGEEKVTLDGPANEMQPEEAENAAISSGGLSAFIGKLKTTYPKIGQKLNSATDYLSVGAAISVGVETNDANVTVGNTAKIDAPKGDINANARMELYDTHMEALGNMTNETENQTSGALVGASVLFADLQNNAKVDIQDGTADVTNAAGTHARLNARGINVNAGSIQNYDRVYGLLDDWKFMYSNLMNLSKDIKAFGESEDVTEEFQSDAEAFGQLYNDLKGSIVKITGLNIADYSVNLAQEPQSIAQVVMMGMSLLAGIQHAAASLQNSKLKAETNNWIKTAESQILMWLTPESYMNFVAGSSVGMESNANKTAALSGAVNINLLQNNAEVHVGDNAVLNATGAPVSVGTDVSQTTVVMNGVSPLSIDDQYLVNIFNDLLYTTDDNGKTSFSPILNKNGWDKEKLKKLRSDFNPKNLVDVNLTASGANAVGGIASVSQHDAKGTVIVDDGAQLTGRDASTDGGMASGVNIEAKNDKVMTDISLTAGKAGTVGMEGIFAWAGGKIENNIDISGDAKLTSYALGNATDKYGDVNVLGQVDTIFTNVGGGAMWGSAGSTDAAVNAAVGATVTLTDVDVNNIVNIGGGNASGSIDAHSLNVNALTDGVINTIAIAGSASTDTGGTSAYPPSKELENLDNDELQNRLKELLGEEKFDDIAIIDGDDLEGEEKLDIEATLENYGNQYANRAQEKANQNVKDGSDLTKNTQQGSTNNTGTASSSPKFQLAAAGSVALDIGTADTKAIISHETINLHNGNSGDKAVNVKAEDAIYSGAYAGSAAMTWKQGDAFTKEGATVDGTKNTTRGKDTVLDKKTDGNGVENTAAPNTGNMRGTSSLSVAMAGAAAINVTVQDVIAKIESATINDADKVQNLAQKDGATVAAAFAGALSNSSGNLGSTFAGAGSASLNVSDNDITAEIGGSDINTTAKGAVQNIAYDSDTQVAGGVNVEFARSKKMSAGLGGSLAFNDVYNDVSAKIDNGSKITSKNGTAETPGGKVTNHAAVNLTQVGAAVGVSAVTGQGKGAAIDGTLSSNSANNKIYASIDKATINAKSIDNAAYDAGDLKKTHDQTLEDSGVNATAGTYMENVTQNAATEGKDPEQTKDISNNDYDISIENNKSTKQITVALSVAVDTQSSGAALGGAAAVGVLQNDIEATITDSTINTPGEVKSAAESNALMVNVAAGVAVSAGGLFGGAGSASGQYTDNKTMAAIDDSTVKADTVSAEATSKDLDVNIAGQASWGKVGGGLAVTYNHQDNATSAYMRGDTINEYTAGNGVAISLSATNNGQAYSVGAGVSGGTEGAANGSLAINQGRDDLNAVIDKTDSNTRMKISNARSVSASVSDKSMKVAVAGAINGAGTAAVGGAVAFNEIGNWRKDKDYTFQQENQQQTMAAINNADITTVSQGGDKSITVSAFDEATFGTAATGMGGAGTAAVEGAAAVSVIGRESYALMTNTNITPVQTGKEIAVNLSSKSAGSIYNNALVAAGAGDAAVGAGVAVDYDSSDATAQIAGGTISAANVDVQAESKDKILNIGVGGGGAAYAAVNGSIAVNILAGHTEANIIGNTTYDHGDNFVDENGVMQNTENDVVIGDAKIASSGNVIVSAKRSGSIDNIAGLAAGTGIGASVGLTVGVNDIQNATGAKISGTNTVITATGNGTAETVADTIKDDQFLTDYPGNVSGSIQPAHYMERKDSAYKGVAVSASSTNEIHSWDVNIAGNGEGAAVTGNVNVNIIGGSTIAAADAKSIDAGTGDINVIAHDYANNTAYVGSLSGAGLGAGVGVGSTTLTVDRDVKATAAGQGSNAKLKAKDIGVKADAEYAVGNITAALAGAAFAGVANVDNITLLQGTSTASLDNYDAELGGNLDVNAKHGTNIYTIGITGTLGIGAVGMGIDVVQDESETKAELKNGSIALTNDNKSVVSVSASNVTNDTYMMYTLGGGAVSANGNVSVGNFDASVDVVADGVNVGSGATRAKSVDVKAVNEMSVTPTDWTGGVGGLAVGVGVQVATIGSDVNAAVKGSKLYANDINITSRDERKADLMLGNTEVGGGSAILNVGVLTAGHKVENTYAIDSTDADGNTTSNDSGANLAYVFDADGTVNSAIEGNRLTADKSMGTGQAVATVKTDNGADKADASKADENTTNTSVKESTLDAGSGEVSLISHSIINATEQNISTAATATVSASGQVSVLDAARNASVVVTDSDIKGKDVAIVSNLSGSSKIDTYQGAAATTALAGAFGFIRDASVNNVSLTGSTISASGNVRAKTTDTSTSEIDAVAVQPSIAVSASLQVAEADIVGSSTVNLGKDNTIRGASIDIAATNAQDVTTSVNAGNASIGIAGGVSVSTIEIGDKDKKYNTALTVADDNTFIAPAISLSAEKNTKENAKMKALSVGSGGVVVNYATAQDYSSVNTTIGKAQYGNGDTQATLNVSAANKSEQVVNAASANADLFAAIANNTAKIDNIMDTSVSAGGTKGGTNLKAANIAAISNTNTKAESSTFGGSLINVAAAETELAHRGNTTAHIAGSWKTAEGFTLSAKNDETLSLDVDTASASVAGGSGGGLNEDVSQTAAVTAENATVTTGGDQNFIATNTAKDTSRMDSSGFGFLDSTDATRLDADKTYRGSVNLNNAAFTAKDGSNINAYAATLGSHTTDNKMVAVSVGVDEAMAYTYNRLTYDNDVTAKGSTLKTTGSGKAGNVTLAAYDNTIVDETIMADSEGILAGASSGHLDTSLTRTNDVKLTGNTIVTSAGDANLYASRDETGRNAGTTLNALTETYNRTLIPFTNSSDIDLDWNQANVVTVDAASKLQSVQDIHLAADRGADVRNLSSKKYEWFTDSEHNGSITVTESGVKNSNQTVTNNVTIGGTAIAGLHNGAKVTITGNVTANNDKTVNFDGIQVEVTEGGDWLKAEDFRKEVLTSTDFQTGEVNPYVNPYYDNYASLVEAQKAYPPGTEAYNEISYQIASLCEAMASLGYADKGTDGSGNTVYTVYKTCDIVAVIMPDITVSGGNVDVQADALNVTGSLSASQGSNIEVDNKSSVSLVVNDVIIPKAGGNVYYNNDSVNSASSGVSGLTGAANIQAAAEQAMPTISIKNTGNVDKNLGHTPDIDVRGTVKNENGSVNLSNANGSIKLEATAEVSGLSVNIQADNGNVVQDNPTGIVNVGGDPIPQWMGSMDNQKNIQKVLHWAAAKSPDGTYSCYANTYEQFRSEIYMLVAEYNRANLADQVSVTLPDRQPGSDASSGIHAGGIVAISGHEVNVNGLIQSGYTDYTVNLNQSATTKIANLDNASYDTSLADSVLKGNAAYCIDEGGAYFDNQAGCWKYHVPVYYNPATKHIVVSDVSASGGSVTITGNVGSTGNGRIYVATGAANIDIDTTVSGKEVVLGSITNKDRTGEVRIVDHLKGETYDRHFSAPSADTYKVYNSDTDRLRYSWTGGVSQSRTDHYSYSTDAWLWGLIESDSDEKIKSEYGTEENIVGTTTNNGETLPISDFFKVRNVEEDAKNAAGEISIVTNYEQNTTGSTAVKTEKDEKGLFGWIKTVYTYSWDEYVGENSTTLYNLNSNHDISIRALQADTAGIKATSQGNLIVGSNITSAATNADHVTLTSNSGSITGDGVISTNNLTVKAATGIDVNHAAIKTAATSDTDYLAKVNLAAKSGDITFRSRLGDVNIQNITASGAGAAADIRAKGNILNGAADGMAAVTADKIDITAGNGTIGTADKALTVNGGQTPSDPSNPESASIGANAYGDIYLTETEGDMRVDQIESKTGDVVLTATKGSIVNASSDTTIDDAVSDSLIDKWYNAGLISRSDAADSNTNSSANAKAIRLNGMAMRFRQLALDSDRTVEDYKTAASTYANDATLNAARGEYLSVLRGTNNAADLAAAKNAYKTAIEAYFARTGVTYSDSEKTAISNYGETLKDDNGIYGWSKNDLANALRESLVNRKPGTVRLPEEANVKGATVTLNAIGGIGTAGEVKTYAGSDILAHISEIKNAPPGSIYTQYDANGKLSSITIDEAKPLYVETKDADNTTVKVSSYRQTYLGTTVGKSLTVESGRADKIIGSTADNAMFLAANGLAFAKGTVINARNLSLLGGSGSIGTDANKVTTNIKGTLTANSGKSIYVDNIGEDAITLSSITAGEDVYIASQGDIMESASSAGSSKNNTGIYAGNNLTLISRGGNIAINSAVAKQGSATITANGSIRIGSLSGGENVVVDSNGTGDITLYNVIAGHDAVIRQNGIGNIFVDGLTAGNNAMFVARNGNMDLANVTAANRIDIFNFGRDKETRMDNMRAGTFLSFLAYNPVIGSVSASAPRVYDVLGANDSDLARKAIGWYKAGDIDGRMVLKQYWFGFDRYSLGAFRWIDTEALRGAGFWNLPKGKIALAVEGSDKEENENRDLFD